MAQETNENTRFTGDALTFKEDHRKTVFGQMLDHIYVRSLTPENTGTHNVKSSDHNPLSAELSF